MHLTCLQIIPETNQGQLRPGMDQLVLEVHFQIQVQVSCLHVSEVGGARGVLDIVCVQNHDCLNYNEAELRTTG